MGVWTRWLNKNVNYSMDVGRAEIQETRSQQQEALSWIECAYLIWSGKWIVIGLVVLGACVAAIYVYASPTVYQAKYGYSINLASLEATQFCEGMSGAVRNSR